MRIGRLSIHLLTGKYVVEDMTIDGLRPGDRPFFTAKRIAVAHGLGDRDAPAARVPDHLRRDDRLEHARREVGGRAQLPEVHRGTTRRRARGVSRRRSSICARIAASSRTRITSRRGASSAPTWTSRSATCRTITAKRSSRAARCRFRTTSRCGPTCARASCIDGPHVDLDRIEFDTDGAKTVARGSVELGKRWPEQSYDFESRVQFPRMDEIFFADQNWDLTGDGDFTGKFHLFKGGHDLSGTFTSDVLGWNEYRFPELSGVAALDADSVRRDRTRARSSSAATREFTYSIKPLGQQGAARRRGSRPATRTPTSPRSATFRSGRVCVWPAAWSGHNLLEWPTGRFVERRDEGIGHGRSAPWRRRR